MNHRPQPRRTVSLGLLLVWLVANPASGQQFGQWWWLGSAGLVSKRVETDREGAAGSEFGSDRFRLRLGLRGYVINPLIGSFKIDLSGTTEAVQGGREVENDFLGVGGELKLFPLGWLPLSVYYNQGAFDHQAPRDEELRLFGLPDSQRTYGGRVRSRWKWSRGLSFSFLDREVQFLDRELGSEGRQEQELRWRRRLGSTRTSATIKQRRQRFARGSFSSEDVVFSFNQNSKLGNGWQWNQALGGSRGRVLGSDRGASEALSFSSQVAGPVAGGDEFRLGLGFGMAQSGPVESETTSLDAAYSRELSRHWSIAVSTSYSEFDADGAIGSASGAALAASWKWNRRSLSASVTSELGYVVLDGRGDQSGVGDSESSSALISVSFAASGPWKLREQLDLEYSTNEVIVSSPAEPDQIDFELVVNRRVLADVASGQLTVSRRWGRFQASSSTILRRSESASGLGRPATEGFVSESLSENLQISRARFDLTGTASILTVSGGDVLRRQRADLRTLGVRWRPLSYLSFSVTGRSEDRETAFGPRIDFQRIEASARFSRALLSAGITYFETVSDTGPGTERGNRGLSWFVTRQAAGLFPVISAPKRRGTIR